MKAAVGDYITFKIATIAGCKKVRRRVVARDAVVYYVRYLGWDNFIVYFNEISKVEKKGK
jgi:hypothetical protein